MTTKELIKAKIDSVPDEHSDEVYTLIKTFTRPAQQAGEETFMSKLRSIHIDAPEDFSANLDAYMNGEKSDEKGIH